MAPKHWANELQLEWLHSKMGGYLASKAGGDQIEFFSKLDEAWLGRWPEEEACGLPGKESGTELSTAQTEQLAVALNGRKQQLRVWYRNHVKKDRESGTKTTKKDDTLSISAALWRETRRHRDPQLIELWQKVYPERVKEALEAGGYYAAKAGELEWVTVDEDSNDASTSERLKKLAAERMKLWRKITLDAFEDEGDEIKAEMEAELKKVKAKKLASKEPVKLSPESADASIKQLEAIIEHFHDLIQKKTGWRGFSVLGGPTPSSGGRLNYTVYSCGRTPAGNTFKESHPKWEQDLGQPFSQWLSRCYTRFERDSMALPNNGDDSDSDTEAEEDLQEEEQVNLKVKAKAKGAKNAAPPPSKAPKRAKKAGKSIASATTATGQAPQGYPILPPPVAPALFLPPPIAPAEVTPTPMVAAPALRTASARDWLARAASPLDDDTWEPASYSRDSDLPHGPGPVEYAQDSCATGSFYIPPEAGYDFYIPMSPRTAAGLDSVFAHGMDAMPSLEAGADIAFATQALNVVGGWGESLGGWGAPVNGDLGSSTVFSFAGATAGEGDDSESGLARPVVSSPYHAFSAPYAPQHLSSPLGFPSAPAQPPRRSLTPAIPPRRSVTPESSVPPRFARSLSPVKRAGSRSTPSIVSATRALQVAMEAAQKRDKTDESSVDGDPEDEVGDDEKGAGLEDDDDAVKGDGQADDSSDEDEAPLSRYYPASRPMANAPKSKKVPCQTKAPLAKATRPKGKVGGRAGLGGRVNNLEKGVDGGRVGPAREKPVRTPFTFLQTYGPNGEVIPLPLSMAGEIFGNKGARGKAGAAASVGERPKPKPRNLLQNRDGPSDLIILPRPMGGAMPTIPELGRPGRNRRPPKNANDDLAVLEALKARKAAQTKNTVAGTKRGADETEETTRKK
ncbi:hypothetical protein B0H15DRAFT_960345 [Mycena belliarum]|uniref:Uncharacterized protein n=1 Tax=Mycena belliarum TaxID=1033014 RepID=A0AAD6UIV7_9AGAR|nr:hypothetical protein B0H15DRAFT_960345 [Mycena belliae]